MQLQYVEYNISLRFGYRIKDFKIQGSVPRILILGVHIILAPFVVSIFGQMPLRLDRVLSLGLIFLSIELINRYFPIILQLKGLKKIK